ncbi:MAG TPA: four helix bundle protein [Verrucomicrobiaceae bacterium]
MLGSKPTPSMVLAVRATNCRRESSSPWRKVDSSAVFMIGAWGKELGARSKKLLHAPNYLAYGWWMSRFRFEDFDIWKKAVAIGMKLADWADELEQQKKFRFAEQLRAASLSVSNNIAEGSGSQSNKDFANFLNVAKRSTFETANMTIFFQLRGIIPAGQADELLAELEVLSRMIERFRKSLL